MTVDPNDYMSATEEAQAAVVRGDNAGAMRALAHRDTEPAPSIRVAKRLIWATAAGKVGDLSRALAELDLAEAEAAGMGDTLLATKARTAAGSMLANRGRTTEALTSAIEAMVMLDELPPAPPQLTQILATSIRNDIGELLLEIGVPSHAIEQLRQAKVNDDFEPLGGLVRMNLARAYFEQALREQRRHDQGWERSARRASAQAAVCLRSPHPQRRVEAATVAGGVSAIRGDTSAAGRMLVGVVGLLDQIDAPATVARHLILLGLTLRTSGHAADALPWLRWAVELDSRITDLGLVARCHYELAKAYRDLGDLALALQHFEHGRAIEFRRSSDHVNGLVTHLVGQAELASAHRHLVKTSDALEDQARLDPLTGVPNRLALSLYVAQLAADDNPDVAALFVDIDHFKVVNDTGGHAAGDEVLRSIAKVVQDALRGDDQIFRYGGDEFVVLLPGTDASMAHDIAERIRSSVSDACATVMGGTTVTVSVGCCVGMGTDASSVIAGADAAVYLAKRAGRNRVAVSAPRPPMSI